LRTAVDSSFVSLARVSTVVAVDAIVTFRSLQAAFHGMNPDSPTMPR
jgi:hypothetical protein